MYRCQGVGSESRPQRKTLPRQSSEFINSDDNKYIQIFSIVAFQGDLLDSPHTVRVFVTVNKQFPYLCSNLCL